MHKRLWQFARSTNIEGVNNAGRAGGGARTTVWLLLTVLLLALTANDIRQLVNNYINLFIEKISSGLFTERYTSCFWLVYRIVKRLLHDFHTTSWVSSITLSSFHYAPHKPAVTGAGVPGVPG